MVREFSWRNELQASGSQMARNHRRLRGQPIGSWLHTRFIQRVVRDDLPSTLAQHDLPNDTDILRTLARHNRVQVGDAGVFPCAGVYAVIAVPGIVRTGDPVVIT